MKISLVTFALFGFALAAAAPEPAADLQRRGYTCTIGGDDLCNTVVSFILGGYQYIGCWMLDAEQMLTLNSASRKAMAMEEAALTGEFCFLRCCDQYLVSGIGLMIVQHLHLQIRWPLRCLYRYLYRYLPGRGIESLLN